MVVPSFDRAATLPRALDSALDQQGVPSEIVVVDDGSRDDTEGVLARYGDRIEVLRQPQGGVARARNRGIAGAEAEFVAFLDSDDFWLANKSARQIAFLDAHPEVALVCSDYRAFEEDPPAEIRIVGERTYSGPCDFSTLFGRNFVGTSTVVVRKSALDAVGPFDTTLTHASDYDMWLRIARRFAVARLPETLACYRRAADSLTGLDAERDVRSWHAVTSAWIERDPGVLDEVGVDRAAHRAELARRLECLAQGTSIYD